LDPQTLAEPWMKEGDRPYWFSRSAWALRTLVDSTKSVSGKTPILWLPDYFCDQATWPLRQSDVRLVFYPVDDRLDPIWAACESLAEHEPPDLFTLVHYFGFVAETAEARKFCNNHDAALIEDAAHLLGPTEKVGRDADFVLYSLYKHLPMPDGGLLIVRPSATSSVRALEASWREQTVTAPSAKQWLLKRLIQVTLPSLATRLSGNRDFDFDKDPPIQPLPATGAISASALRLLGASIGELDRVAGQRRSNEQALREVFSEVEGLRPLFPAPGATDIPYRAVFRAADHETARRWYQRIMSSGNIVESWPDLPSEIRAGPAHHAIALALRSTVLTVPVNSREPAQDLAARYGAALSGG
jgi:hypothetical protein